MRYPVPRKKRKTAFVPRFVFRGAVAGVSVVPVCVAAGAASFSTACGVAAVCFCDGGAMGPECCVLHPADAGDAARSNDARLAVADVGFTDVVDGGG
jgi:hypothetical protein